MTRTLHRHSDLLSHGDCAVGTGPGRQDHEFLAAVASEEVAFPDRLEKDVGDAHEQIVAGTIPRLPVYIDSPLAVNATEVFKMHPECYDTEARAFQRATGDILGHGCCTYIRDVEESKALHRRRRPCVIISASGMCEAGRIRHHLKNNIRSKKNTILIPGFQARHTLGRRLADGADKINLFHQKMPVRAEVVQVHGFSGHADQTDLLHMLAPLAGKGKRVFLVHGEEDQSEVLASKLRETGAANITVATHGQRIEL